MRAFLLAAGFGTRLGKLSYNLPKALIPFGNVPFINYPLRHLASIGVKDFIVNSHYKSEKMLSAFKNKGIGYGNVKVVVEEEILDSGGGIANVENYLRGGDFLAYNCDIISDLPLGDLVKFHKEKNAVATLALRTNGESKRVFADNDSCEVTGIRETVCPQNSRPYQFTGIYILSEKIFDYFKKYNQRGKFCIINTFQKLIKEKNKVLGCVLDTGTWADIGSSDKYIKLHQKIFDPKNHFPIYNPSFNLNQNLSPQNLENYYIDENSFVAENVNIGNGVKILNSIIWRNATISDYAKIENCVVTENSAVSGNQSGKIL